MSTVLYILVAILLLGILIAVHEFGHFIAARLTGIEVREFSIGFGPKILSFKGRKHPETTYSLRALPLGGFNSFSGEDDTGEEWKTNPKAFPNRPVWARMITVLMGPGMNFVLAFIVLLVWVWIGGVQVAATVEPWISSVESGSPAEAAGIMTGDVVLTVNGADVQDGTMDTMTSAIGAWREGDAPLELTIRRGEETVTAEVTPFLDETEHRYRVGIGISGRVLTVERRAVGFIEAVSFAWDRTVYVGGTIARALRDLLTTGKGFEDTAGPVGTVSIITEQVREGGFEAFLNLLVMISVNLGLVNLLPIPSLDGARFLFLVLELIRRKPVKPEREAIVNLVGLAILLGVMVIFTFRDVIKLFR